MESGSPITIIEKYPTAEDPRDSTCEPRTWSAQDFEEQAWNARGAERPWVASSTPPRPSG